ncbi:MAG: hypothetical protein JHD15_08525 [Phenylobacterium sp.]|uniref:hypothetical protein n=1 Tax=Phenylobacterium sp. TaxID=1871053 RepID=UPI001A31802E|nr:hypothetical protein [Phenylobacterium sp.]MBJ7410394.1 hypothetical protein [Phenylobacterium sp.]
MSGTLELRVNQGGLPQAIANAVVVTVRQVLDAAGRYPEQPFERIVPVPAGGDRPAVLDVPDGTYALSARLSSGEALSKTVTVGEGQASPATFDLPASGHEWLSWQTLVGGVDSADARSRRRRSFTNKNLEQRPLRAPTMGYLSSVMPPPALAPGPTPAPAPASILQFALARGQMTFDAAGFELDPNWSIATQSDPDVHQWAVRPLAAPAPPSYQLMGLLETLDAKYVALLPSPWLYHETEEAPAQAGAIDIVFDQDAPSESALKVAVHEPRFTALLGYLGAGRLGEAAHALGDDIGGEITKLLQGKLENPFAAAGAAYVGLTAVRDRKLRERWAPWLTNLEMWFPWLPDGAILQARDRLDRAETLAHLDEAREGFKRAFQRGVPLYSAGLQHLLDGLRTFSEPTSSTFDPEAADMAHQVAEVASRVDPTQPFTVLALPRNG